MRWLYGEDKNNIKKIPKSLPIFLISFGIVVFNADYGIPLIIGEIGGIIFIISAIIIAIDAITQMVNKKE